MEDKLRIMYDFSDFKRRYNDLKNLSHSDALGFYIGLNSEAIEKYETINLDDLTDYIQTILSNENILEFDIYSQRYHRRVRAIKNKYPKSNITVALAQYENKIIDDFHKIPLTIADMFDRKESLGEGYFIALSVEVVRYINNMSNYIDRLIYITEIRRIYIDYLDSYHVYLAMMTAKKEKPSKRLHELFKIIEEYDDFVRVLKTNDVIDELSGFENQYEFNPQFINREGLSTAKASASMAYILFLNKQLNTNNKSKIADSMQVLLSIDFSKQAFNSSWDEFRNEENEFKKSKYGSAFHFLFK